MNRTTTLLALAAGTTALLTACGSGATSVPVAPVAAPQAAPTSVAAPAAPRPAPASDPGATIDADDQSGDGTTVVVRDVRLTGGPGWVVVRTDDDRDGRVLGSVAVPAGQAGPVTVTLTEPVPTTGDDDDDLTAVLHLDDGDGVFDESRDAAVLDEDDDDDDGDDIEDDDFDYRVA